MRLAILPFQTELQITINSVVLTPISSSSTHQYLAPNCVPSTVPDRKNTETCKIQACSHEDLRCWSNQQTNAGHGPTAQREPAFSEKWLLLSPEGFLLRVKHVQLTLAECWPVYTVCSSAEIPLPEIVMDHNQIN